MLWMGHDELYRNIKSYHAEEIIYSSVRCFIYAWSRHKNCSKSNRLNDHTVLRFICVPTVLGTNFEGKSNNFQTIFLNTLSLLSWLSSTYTPLNLHSFMDRFVFYQNVSLQSLCILDPFFLIMDIKISRLKYSVNSIN